MFKKVWCTCKAVVLRIKPIVFFDVLVAVRVVGSYSVLTCQPRNARWFCGCFLKVVTHRGSTVSLPGYFVAWKSSWHFARTLLISTRNDVWGLSVEILWRATTQIWVVLLSGRPMWEICFNQAETVIRSGWWRVISMEFLRSFLRHHFA